MINVKKRTLKNGLKILYVPFKEIHSVYIEMAGKAGAIYDPEKAYGTAHFLEHVVHEGTEKYPDHDSLTAVIKNVGGKSNATTSRSEVRYYCKLLDKDIEKGFDFISQVVIHPLLDSKQVIKHREIIRQELKRHYDNPENRFYINTWKYTYPNSPRCADPVSGRIGDILKITRSDLSGFIKEHYNSENFVIGICGNTNGKKVFDLAERYFGEMKKGINNKIVQTPVEVKPVFYAKNDKHLSQTTLTIVYPGLDQFNEDRFASKIMAYILGRGSLSRLYKKIRNEKGLAYTVGAGSSSSPSHGLFHISTKIEEKNLEQVISIIKDELSKISSEPVGEDELERVQNNIIANFTFNEEDPEYRCAIYTDAALYGQDEIGIDYYLRKYREVRIDDVLEISNKILSQEPKVFVFSNSATKSKVKRFWEKS